MEPLLKILCRMFLLVLLLGALVSCESAPKPTKPLTVYLMLSVDWEGDTLRDNNLQAMRAFNKRLPHYPFSHFLNAAYYSKKDFFSTAEINQRVRSVLKENDEIGLHIHSWQNLVEASGVPYRPGPSFWGTPESRSRGAEKGDDVPLNIYNVDEIQQIVEYSLKKLQAYGFTDIQSFRGGGWMSGPKVHKALLKAGIRIDSSAVPPQLIENLYPGSHLAKLNMELWPDVSKFSMPYKTKVSEKVFFQFPNNLGLADYVTGEEFFQAYLEILAKAQQQGQDSIYLHFGWHQESAVEYFEHQKSGGRKLVESHFLKRVERGLNLLEDHARKEGHKILPVTFKSYPQKHF